MRPVLFRIDALGWEVQSYGALMAVALLGGYFATLALAHRAGIRADRFGTVYVASAVAALFLGRIGWILQHPAAFDGARSLVTLQAGTFAPFFAAFAGLTTSAILAARRKVEPLAWFDVLTPALAIGIAFEHIGALLAGTGVGTYAPNLPWAIRYPVDSTVYADHVARLGTLLRPGAEGSLPVHPTQVYGVLLAGLGIALVVVLRRRRRTPGQVFLWFATYHVVIRAFVEEWFRVDAATPVLGPLNGGQVGALVLCAGLLAVARLRGRRPDPEPSRRPKSQRQPGSRRGARR
jgi:phosphatidylglycerol---prolipoprotein diacylglyceryl transferase